MITYEEEVDNENINVSNHSEPDAILNIKSNLLKPPERLKVGNRLLEDIKYERASGSGVFEALPNIVKFQGFEINKKQTIKLLLVNKSKFSQRIALIPPTTPFFKIKFTKRGLIAPGLSEIVYVTFIPQTYQYYYDYIRVICEGDKIMVPIHAYPKMNLHLTDYVPRFIDFGTIAINAKGQREIELRNIITLPFEFEFVPIKTCEEIRIEPLYGDVEAVSNKTITFTFTPNSYGLFISEYEFRLSEYEYKPFIITITGNCNVFEKVLNENILIHMKKQREKKLFGLKSQIASIDSRAGDENNYGSYSQKNLSEFNSKLDMDKVKNNNNINNLNGTNNNTYRNSQKGLSQKTATSPRNVLRTPNSNLPNENFNIPLSNNDGNINNNLNSRTNNSFNNNNNINNYGEIVEENENLIKSSRHMSKNASAFADGKAANKDANLVLSPTASAKFNSKIPAEGESPNINSFYDAEGNLNNNNNNYESKEFRDSASNFANSNYNSNYNTNNNNNDNTALAPFKAEGAGNFSKKYKSFPSTKERDYLQYYNGIETTIKDKEIKYLRFIGKKLLTDEQTNKIIAERIKDFESNLSLKRSLDLNRFKFELDTAKCTVDRLNQYYLKPTLNFNFNDKFFKTRNYFKIFLKLMTKVVIRKRAEKNLDSLKRMMARENIKNAKDFADYAERDWTQQLTKDQETQESKMKIKFVKPPALTRTPVFLSYDYNLESLKQEISHDNNINLEELQEYTKLDPSDVEIMGYKEFKSNGITLYEVSTDDKVLRSGAENENPIRSERGDSEQTMDKIAALLDLPKTYKNHIETKIDTLLFNNPSLKKYCQYPEYNEAALDYNLQPRFIDTSDYLKNVFSAGFNYQNDIYNKLPLTIYENIQLREVEKNLICDSYLDFAPKKMPCADHRELFIKKNGLVDEDNYIIDIPREDEAKVQESIEKDDEVIQKLKEMNKEEVVDPKEKEKVNLESYLQSQKRKWISTLPTVLEFYNTGMSFPNNKFIL